MDAIYAQAYPAVIDSICDLGWSSLTEDDLTDLARAYYYFSVQFRENLQAARFQFPNDHKLAQLEVGECDTDNLSPWPGVAGVGERMNHDEFMRRLLCLSQVPEERRRRIDARGELYLQRVREVDPKARAISIASYEDGGLERVFNAFLQAKRWDSALLRAFRHFLVRHIEFDSDVEQGHGSLSRHLTPDDRILPLWAAFQDLLVESVPALKAMAGAR